MKTRCSIRVLHKLPIIACDFKLKPEAEISFTRKYVIPVGATQLYLPQHNACCTTDSPYLSENTKECYNQCQNINCGHTFQGNGVIRRLNHEVRAYLRGDAAPDQQIF